MTSLVVLLWLGLLDAAVRAGRPTNSLREAFFLASEASCLAAVMVEAGRLETKRPSTLGRPLQVLALVTAMANLVASALTP